MILTALIRAASAFWAKLNAAGMPPKPASAPAQPPKNVTVSPQPTVSQPAPKPQPQPSPPIVPIASGWSCLLPYEYDDAANTSWYGNFDWQKDFIGTDQSRYLGNNNEFVDKLSDTNLKYEEKAIKPRSEGWDNWLGDQMARCVKSGKRYIELDNADYALDRDRSVVMETYKLANSLGLAIVLKNPTARDVVEFGRLTIAGAVFEQGALSPREFSSARKSVVPTMQATWVRHGGNINGQDIPEIASQVREVPGTSVQWGPGEYNGMRIVASNPFQAEMIPTAAPAPAPAPTSTTPSTTPDPSVPYAAEYLAQWRSMQIKPERVAEVNAIARKLLAAKPRYQAVEAKTGVPWYLIAVLHERESGADFSTYLGNGEPLNRRTRLVPAGRGPFSSWEAGAEDALAYDGLSAIKAWPIERVAYSCEKYNGMGYRSHGVPSPYLWSFSSVYRGGKYVADGEWSASAQDQQCGTMPLIKAMAALDGGVSLALTGPTIGTIPVPPPKPVPPPDAPELHDLGHRIKRTMLAKYPQAWFPDQNVVSIEKMNPDGSPCETGPNTFDDIKMVLDGDGRIIGGPWEATTHPGKFWTEHPMAEGGAFIIALGPQACWTPGDYHGDEVWRQSEDSSIMGHRDPNATYKRQGPPIKHGDIGVHHHHGYNLPKGNISNAAAGCQVIRLNDKQEEFMRLTKKCPRYLADPSGYRLTATVLEAKDILP